MSIDPEPPVDQEEEGVKEAVNFTPETLKAVRGMLDQADHYLRQAKQLIFQESLRGKVQRISPPELITGLDEGQRVVEGVFDGENMLASDGHQYPVPPNYASKSKLVPGDVLKLTVASDGSFIFKQIGPVGRQKLIGILEEEGGIYFIAVNHKRYRVLKASITYFHAKPGDKLTVIVPLEGEVEWVAVENLVQ